MKPDATQKLDDEIGALLAVGFRDSTSKENRAVGMASLDTDEIGLLYMPSDTGGVCGRRGWYFWVRRHWRDRFVTDKEDRRQRLGPGKDWSDLRAYPSAAQALQAAQSVQANGRRMRRSHFIGMIEGALLVLVAFVVWRQFF